MAKNNREIRVLVAPLDWGMGHAARCIPIVNQLLERGCAVWVAGEGDGLSLLQMSHPNLHFTALKGYRVIYQRATEKFQLKILKQVPKILRAIRNERKWVNKFVTETEIDFVISDNRFGLYTRNAYTIFITHQLSVKSGVSKSIDLLIRAVNYSYIKKFNECWVPDFEGGHNLAGELSHPDQLPPNTSYIGPLSRLNKKATIKKYDLLIILSGPEPARSNFESKLLDELRTYEGKTLLVRGTTMGEVVQTNVEMVNLMQTEALEDAINSAEYIICRSGYTSIMDLTKLEAKAILVPTPGQTEQTYLADYLARQKMFYTMAENQFNLKEAIAEVKNFTASVNRFPESFYQSAIDNLLKRTREN